MTEICLWSPLHCFCSRMVVSTRKPVCISPRFARVSFPSILVSFSQGETQSLLDKSLSLYCDKTSNRGNSQTRGRVSGAHSLRGQSALKRKSRWQKCEAAGHIVSTVRKQTWKLSFIFSVGSPSHGMGPPIFMVGLYISFDLFWNHSEVSFHTDS